MDEDGRLELLQRRVERERKRREEAEDIAEESTRDLYERTRELEKLAATLEERVDERTRQLEQRLAQQATVAEVSGQALAGMELGELVEKVCGQTAGVLATDYCGVFELQPGEEELVLRAGVGWPEETVGTKTVDAVPECQTGYTLRHREPIVVDDVYEDERFHAPALLEEEGIRSGITVVVPGPEDPWGVFGVHSRQPRGFDEDDAAFVESMAHVLSQTIRRDRSREELEAYADRLERANEDLEHFVHLASHDLQEPVRAVSTSMDLLASRYADGLEEEALELVHQAQQGAQRIHGMIEGLLRYTRVETADKERVDAGDVFDDVLRSLAVKIEDADARIERGELPTVRADRAQLGQVFQNLIANGIKFAEPDEPPRITVDASSHDGAWRFSVEDEGTGMDPEDTDEVFEMFRQGSGERGDGHGIGLAVCQRIVERHGGEIWVDTQPGEGSTFHFTLPRPEEHEEGDG